MNYVSIVIPAYNEEKRISRTLEQYSDYFEKIRKKGLLDYQILVVINNTSDNTGEIVRKFCLGNKRIRYLEFEQGGKGFAVIEGFKYSLIDNFDLLGFVDADMATSPKEFFELIRNIGSKDAIIADRYMKDSEIHPKPTFQRLIAKRMFNFVVRSVLLMPYRDTQCGAKIFRRESVEKILGNLSMSQWAFDVEILYHLRKNNFRVKSHPTKWMDKEYSKINFWSSGLWMVMAILRLRLLNSKVKEFVRIYDKFVGFVPK